MLHSRHDAWKVLTLVRAYFDESGIDAASPFVAVGGLMANEARWEKIEAEWVTELNRFRDEGFPVRAFHSIECEHGDGDFAPIAKEIREAFPPRLAKIIERNNPICFWSVINKSEWAELTEVDFRSEYPDPFYLCFEWCAQEMVRWQRDVAQATPIALIYSEQAEFEDRIKTIWSAYARAKRVAPLNSFTTASYRDCVPLQAADLVAYECFRRWKEGAPPVSERRAAQILVSPSTQIEMVPRASRLDLQDAIRDFRKRRRPREGG